MEVLRRNSFAERLLSSHQPFRSAPPVTITSLPCRLPHRPKANRTQSSHISSSNPVLWIATSNLPTFYAKSRPTRWMSSWAPITVKPIRTWRASSSWPMSWAARSARRRVSNGIDVPKRVSDCAWVVESYDLFVCAWILVKRNQSPTEFSASPTGSLSKAALASGSPNGSLGKVIQRANESAGSRESLSSQGPISERVNYLSVY